MVTRRWPAVVLGVLALSACYGRPDTLGDPCRADPDCDDEQVCERRVCVQAPPPAASSDGGVTGTTSDGTSGTLSASGGESGTAPSNTETGAATPPD